MAIDDADLLDSVRKLRTYMSNMDNCHVTLGKVSTIEEKVVADTILGVMPKILDTSNEIYQALKIVENSSLFKDMVRKFNIQEEDDDE
jgi:hypothetical protein